MSTNPLPAASRADHGDAPRHATVEDPALQQCEDDIERLIGLSARWADRDPTSIAESVLDTLVEMLDLDFAGIRFNETLHVFVRVGDGPAADGDAAGLRSFVADWLAQHPGLEPTACRWGAEAMTVAAVAMGDIAAIGVLVAGSRRTGFPRRSELLRMKVAASQSSLACREVRERSDRTPPADTRRDKPTGQALAESEWRLNLTINTIPVIAWSATADGMLDFCNRHFTDFVGLPAEQVLGLGFYRIIHPDDIALLLATWQDVMSSKRTREVEGRLRRADGCYRRCVLRQNPLLDEQGNVVKWYGVVVDIEDRKRAEDALNAAQSALFASERNLRLIVDSLPVLAWVAREDGSAEFVNERWAEYAGVEAQQILEWGFLDFYHPDDVPHMVDVWKTALESRDRMELRGRIRRFDGEYRWFFFAGRQITDANGLVRWVGANVEVEDLKRAEDALKASQKSLELIIHTIPAIAWSATPDGQVDFFSKSMLDFCGMAFDEMKDEGYYRIFHPDDLEPMRVVWERVKQSKRGEEVDGRIRRHDGEYRWFTLRQNPLLDAEGAVVKWYGALIEIEDRKRAEEELRRSQSELARVARITTLGELAVSIAHEVNQPLMAIVTNASTCLRWLGEAQFDAVRARQAAERVVRDGHRAGDIVAGIRALARKEPARMAPMNLHDAIREILVVLGGEIRRRGLDASFRPRSPGQMVLGDRTQLQQVLLNLIMNSVEAMAEQAEGHLTITSIAKSDGFAHVSVADTGKGLQEEDRARMFDAFFSTKSGGIGMGLSICRSIVAAHGGSIAAASNSPRGCAVTFTVPLAGGTL